MGSVVDAIAPWMKLLTGVIFLIKSAIKSWQILAVKPPRITALHAISLLNVISAKVSQLAGVLRLKNAIHQICQKAILAYAASVYLSCQLRKNLLIFKCKNPRTKAGQNFVHSFKGSY